MAFEAHGDAIDARRAKRPAQTRSCGLAARKSFAEHRVIRAPAEFSADVGVAQSPLDNRGQAATPDS